MKKIIDELNESNSSNYKIDILKKYQSNELLKRLLKMTYDSVAFTYGISVKRIRDIQDAEFKGEATLESALNILENYYSTRVWTGNLAEGALEELLLSLSKDDAYILKCVIDRDLKINLGKTQINKVFKDLIFDLPYMRCGLYSEKTAKKISFPACLQLKADGRFTYIVKSEESIKFYSRSGEESYFPLFALNFKNLDDGVYVGELLVEGLNDRAEANGLINSLTPPEDKMYVQLWDYLTLDEWSKSTSMIPYIQRLKTLKIVLTEDSKIQIIPTYNVQNIQEALSKTSEFMNQGFEGSILKDWGTPFKDHTSPTQLKLKLEIDADVRITGFTEGTKGTKREQFFGAITFETDDKQVKGQCSGFSDAQLKEFNSKRAELIGKIMTVQFNDLTKGRDNDYYALSHPRFIEIRNDKTETDTLERIFDSRKMAMQLGA